MVSENIKAARRARGLSLAAAAARMGATRQQWHQWEAGQFSPQLGTLERIAKALETTVVELISENA